MSHWASLSLHPLQETSEEGPPVLWWSSLGPLGSPWAEVENNVALPLETSSGGIYSLGTGGTGRERRWMLLGRRRRKSGRGIKSSVPRSLVRNSRGVEGVGSPGETTHQMVLCPKGVVWVAKKPKDSSVLLVLGGSGKE